MSNSDRAEKLIDRLILERLAATANGGSLVVVSGLNEVAYWKWRDGDNYDRLKVGRKVGALVFSPDGKNLAALTADGGVSLRVFDLSPGK